MHVNIIDYYTANIKCESANTVKDQLVLFCDSVCQESFYTGEHHFLISIFEVNVQKAV